MRAVNVMPGKGSPVLAKTAAKQSVWTVAVAIDDRRWISQCDPEALAVSAISSALKVTRLPIQRPVEISLLFCDDVRIRAINKQWRNVDKSTNVLSFPAAIPAGPQVPVPLGDIVLAFDTSAGEARDFGIAFADHISHLIIHGFLHLLGYDHEIESEAENMESCEAQILALMDIKNPYILPGSVVEPNVNE